MAIMLAAERRMNVMFHPACSATNPIRIFASTAEPNAYPESPTKPAAAAIIINGS